MRFLNRRAGLVAVCSLAIVQSIGRFAIPVMALMGAGPELDHPISGELMAFFLVMFVVIGAVGLVAAIGLWMGRRWGYLGTVLVSAATIAFDIWGLVAVQGTAALGLVLPVLFIGYLALVRKSFMAEAMTFEGARGVRN